MIASEPKAAPASAPAQSNESQHATNPYVGILGVFMGAGIATLNGRLLSIGLPDLRGALGFGFDEASWLPTALNMAMMFSGVFVVFLSAYFGPRRILLSAATVLTLTSALLPFASNYRSMLPLVVIAGLSSGTFYSLTMTFVLTTLPRRLIIFGIAAYASDIVFVSNIASAIEGWYAEHLSWHWIFWTAALLTPLMMLCVYWGIPRKPPIADPRPSWRGFAYFSFGVSLLVPGFLSNIQQYRPLETGHALAWVAVPMFAVVWLVALIVIYTHSRLILALGFTIVAFGCWIFAHLDSSWSGASFETVEVLLACGFACSFIGLIGSLVLHGLEAGVLSSAANAATYSGFIHFIRLFGGQAGVALMAHFISTREKFHSNLLGLHVQIGDWLTDERVRMLTGDSCWGRPG